MSRGGLWVPVRALSVVVLLALAGAGAGCSTTHRVTNTDDTPIQRLLVTEAIDRVLEKLSWPDVRGAAVFIETTGSKSMKGASTADEAYLRQAITARLAHAGAVTVDKRDGADYVLLVLVGALGTEQRDAFLGLPKMQSVVIPLALPEVALYKALHQKGFAKIEVLTLDPSQHLVVHHSGPVRAETYWEFRQTLMISRVRTNTSRYLLLDPPVPPR